MSSGLYRQFIDQRQQATIDSLKASLAGMIEFVLDLDDDVSTLTDYVFQNGTSKGKAKATAKDLKNRLNKFKSFLED